MQDKKRLDRFRTAKSLRDLSFKICCVWISIFMMSGSIGIYSKNSLFFMHINIEDKIYKWHNIVILILVER